MYLVLDGLASLLAGRHIGLVGDDDQRESRPAAAEPELRHAGQNFELGKLAGG